MSQEHVQTRTLSPEAQAALDAGDVDALLAFHRQTFGGYVMELDGGGTGDTGDGDTGDGDGTGEDQDTGDGDQDQDGDQDERDPRVARANRQAAQYRRHLRETQQQLEQVTGQQQQTQQVLDALRQALGGDSTDGEDADPAEQVTQLTTQVQELSTTNQQLQAALLVHELAGEAGADPVALLDSRRFSEQLSGMDAGAEDYRTQVLEAMQDAVSKNAAYRSGQGSRRGGSELDGEQREQTKRRPAGLAAAVGAHYGK